MVHKIFNFLVTWKKKLVNLKKKINKNNKLLIILIHNRINKNKFYLIYTIIM